MTQKYHHCPTCGKKGVYLKLQHGEDGYLCRYCQWGVFLDPESDAEKKVLADLEISIRMSRYRNLNEAYDGGWNAHAEHTGAIIKAAENLMDAIENSKRTINHRTQVTDVYFEMESALTELKAALSRGWLSRGKADRPLWEKHKEQERQALIAALAERSRLDPDDPKAIVFKESSDSEQLRNTQNALRNLYKAVQKSRAVNDPLGMATAMEEAGRWF